MRALLILLLSVGCAFGQKKTVMVDTSGVLLLPPNFCFTNNILTNRDTRAVSLVGPLSFENANGVINFTNTGRWTRLGPYTGPYAGWSFYATNDVIASLSWYGIELRRPAYNEADFLLADTNWVRTNSLDMYVKSITWSNRWVDVAVSGSALGAGPAAPALVHVGNDVYGYGYGLVPADDYSFFTCQAPHVLARTNTVFPNFYYNPHVHLSVIKQPTATESNVTFVLTFQVANINGTYGAVGPLTSTIGFANTNEHKVMSFGAVTNNLLQGQSSTVFRGRLQRSASASQDLGTGHDVVVDSLDFHVPVGTLGSEEY